MNYLKSTYCKFIRLLQKKLQYSIVLKCNQRNICIYHIRIVISLNLER